MPKTPEQFSAEGGSASGGKTPEESQDALLTPLEIGALLVPRTPEMLKDAPTPEWHKAYDQEGNEIRYTSAPVGEFSPGAQFLKKGDRSKSPWIFRGMTKDGKAVLESEERGGLTLTTRDLEADYERRSQIYRERTKDGKEAILDVEKVLQESVGFYQGHDLEEFLRELPQEIRFSSKSETRLREALKEGFDKAMLLPSVELQKGNVDKLVQELADKEFTGLSDTDQYTAHYMYQPDVIKNATPRGRPSQKAYLLLYQSGPVPDETKGLSPADKPAQGGNPAKLGLDSLFQQKKWDGLTLEEYLLIQRKEAETRKDHSFDAYSSDDQKSQWTWLLDSRVPRGVGHAFWNPGFRRVLVDWAASGHSDGGLGARPAVVVEIEL